MGKHVDGCDAIRMMMEASGISAGDLSRALGRSRGYITALLAHGGSPRVDTLAAIAEICGYSLELTFVENDCPRQRITLYEDGGEEIEF